MAYASAGRIPPPQRLIKEFTQQTGIQVVSVPTWGNLDEMGALVLHSLERHLVTPDVYVTTDLWASSLEPHLLDLSPYLSERQLGEHLSQIIDDVTFNGRVVGLPIRLNVGMLYYRSDLLAKYGYTHPPRTWDELEAMSARIQQGERQAGQADFWGYIWQGGEDGLVDNALEWQASFGGGRIIEPNGEITVDNPRAEMAFRKASGWLGSITPPSALFYNEQSSGQVFRTGNAAFLRTWANAYVTIGGPDSAVRGRFGVTSLPMGTNQQTEVVTGFQLVGSRYSAHPREAAQLIAFAASAKEQKGRALERLSVPTIPKLFTDSEILEKVPSVGVLAKVGFGTMITPPSKIAGSRYPAVSKAYREAVARMLRREGKPNEVLHELKNTLTVLMKDSTLESARNAPHL